MFSYGETLEIAQYVVSHVNDTVPDFDMFEPDAEAATRTKRGNCFARARIASMALDRYGVEHYLQIASKKPAGLRYRHSQIVIPTLQTVQWGIVIDSTNQTTSNHTFARDSYVDTTTQGNDLTELRRGQIITHRDDFGGVLRRSIGMQTFQPQQGIQRYQEIENIWPR